MIKGNAECHLGISENKDIIFVHGMDLSEFYPHPPQGP